MHNVDTIPVHSGINFTLDVLYNCRWSCDGCYVNKTIQDGFVEGDIDRFINLVASFEESGYAPSSLAIGPTDIFTAQNSLDLLTNPKVKELATPFVRITFNSTFLTVDEKIIDVLNTYPNKEVEFKIVVEAAQFMNDKYLSRVRDNLFHTTSRINKHTPIHPQFNLFDYSQTKLSDTLGEYEKLNDRSYSFFNQGIDYVLSFGRSEDLSKEQKLEMLRWIQNLFNTHVTHENKRYIHFDAGWLTDFQEKVYVYRNGEFYFAPKVYEEYVAFDPQLKVPITHWDAKEFEAFEQKLVVDQYNNIHDKPCGNCRYAPTCTDRGIPYFMDLMNVNECLMPKKAFDVINMERGSENESRRDI